VRGFRRVQPARFIWLPFDERSRIAQRAFEGQSHQLAARFHPSLNEQPLHYILTIFLMLLSERPMSGIGASSNWEAYGVA
jgi:hypothetical protein